MASDTGDREPPAEPDAQLKQLDRLVGTWRVSGEAEGQMS